MAWKPLKELIKSKRKETENQEVVKHFPPGYVENKKKEELVEEEEEQGYEERPVEDVQEQVAEPIMMARQSTRPVQRPQVRMQFEAVEVPTQVSPAIRNNKTGETFDSMQALVYLLNKVEDIDKSLRG
jgi:hypothetical protein